MNNICKRSIWVALFLLSSGSQLSAQQVWDLKTCIEYAHEHNIQIKQSEVSVEQANVSLKLAKEAVLPNLSGTITQTYPAGFNTTAGVAIINKTVVGQYQLSSSVVVFNANNIRNTIRQMDVYKEMQNYNLENIKNNIELSITQAYFQILYAKEMIKINSQILETGKAQLSQTKNKLDAGTIAISDYAQVEAQLSNEKLNLVTAQNSLSLYTLHLKQLLQLPIQDSIGIVVPQMSESSVLAILPDKYEIYNTALDLMPDIKSSKKSIQAAKIGVNIAKSGYYPKLLLGGSLATNNVYNISKNAIDQWNSNFNPTIGATLSIPIYENRINKSNVDNSHLSLKNAQLNYDGNAQTLMQTIETLHENALAGQHSYLAAKEALKSATLSYELVEQQYKTGLTDVVTFLNARTNYINAEQALTQAQFTSLMNIKLLNFYRGRQVWL